MIRRFLCKLGFHQFGLGVVEEIAADMPGPVIEIARFQCRHCPRRFWDDPNTIPDHLLESMKDD
jgi:hypothetical protein